MEVQALQLVSVPLEREPKDVRAKVWRSAAEISFRVEGADHFAWRPESIGAPSAAAKTLGARAPAGRLLPVDDLRPVILAAGPDVMELNLYADDSWVGGIADSGDNVDVLFTPRSYADFEGILRNLGVGHEVAEVADRPVWKP